MINLNFSPFPRIETERTVLREMKHEDVHEYHVIRSDEELNKYIHGSRSQSLEETLAIIDRMNGYVAGNKSIAWTIADKATGKMIGSICIWTMTGDDDSWELGYGLLAKHQGKGLMHEALAAAVGYGFAVMNLPVIHAYTHKDNQRSTSLLERAAFQRNAVLETSISDPAEKGTMVVYSLYKPN